MARCVYPLDAWYSSKVTDAGRTPITFSLHEAYSDRPIQLPCGKCIGCIQDRAEAWSVRCVHESSLHLHSCFATLTYADNPQTLVKSDLQRFFKRLRKDGHSFRYFACGEYGSRSRRPHYHCLFFGQDFRHGSQSLSFGETAYYVSPYVSEVWGHGHVTLAPMQPGSIFYTAGYTLKNMDDPDTFQLSSRKPPIGDPWLSKFSDDPARLGFVTIEGKKFPIPPAYLERKAHLIEFEQIREKRRLHVANFAADHAYRSRASLRGREITLSQSAMRRGTAL